MSVLQIKRTESKFEPISYSMELHKMLREFMQRNFGLKDLGKWVRNRNLEARPYEDEYNKYHYLMYTHKKEIDRLAALMTSNVRAANSIYPHVAYEAERRRLHQDDAICNCESIVKELMVIVDTFEVDINTYKRYISAIDLEIRLIKKWRQKDNAKFSSLPKG